MRHGNFRGYRCTLQPTYAQETLLAQTAGVVWLVYNLALEQRHVFGPRTYTGQRRSLLVPARTQKERENTVGGCIRNTVPTSAMRLSDEFLVLRREFDWIGAVSQTAQNQALVDLDRAFTPFFEGRAGYPTLRKRGRDDSFRQAGWEIAVRRLNGKWSEVQVPKVGWIRYRDTRLLPKAASGAVEIRNATLRRRAGGGWEISIAVRCEIAEAPVPEAACGVDRGVAVPYALSNGEMIHLPLKRRKRALRRARRICRGASAARNTMRKRGGGWRG